MNIFRYAGEFNSTCFLIHKNSSKSLIPFYNLQYSSVLDMCWNYILGKTSKQVFVKKYKKNHFFNNTAIYTKIKKIFFQTKLMIFLKHKKVKPFTI